MNHFLIVRGERPCRGRAEEGRCKQLLSVPQLPSLRACFCVTRSLHFRLAFHIDNRQTYIKKKVSGYVGIVATST